MVNSVDRVQSNKFGYYSFTTSFNWDSSDTSKTIGDSYSTTTDLKVYVEGATNHTIILKNTHATNGAVVSIYYSLLDAPSDYPTNSNDWIVGVTDSTINSNESQAVIVDKTRGDVKWFYVRVKNATAGSVATVKMEYGGKVI